MLCPRCGSPSSSDDRFCGFCGYNLTVPNNSDFETMHAMKVKDVKFDLGVLYFKEGKYEEALSIFEQVNEANPGNLQVLDMCARIKEALNSK